MYNGTVNSQIPHGLLCARIEQLSDLLMGISRRVSRRGLVAEITDR